MDRVKLWRVQESAGIQAIGRDEVAPFLAPVGELKTTGRGAKAAVRGRNCSRGLRCAETRPRGDLNHQAGFVAILRRWPARDDFERLNRIQRNLVREDLVLLVCDGLTVH